MISTRRAHIAPRLGDAPSTASCPGPARDVAVLFVRLTPAMGSFVAYTTFVVFVIFVDFEAFVVFVCFVVFVVFLGFDR